MKHACLLLLVCFCIFFKTFSQSVILPKLSKYKDSTNNYYISICEEYLDLFDKYKYYEPMCPDSCKIDFSKYDLKGIKENGEWKWQLVSLKKYHELTFDYLIRYDTIRWNWLTNNTIINDSAAFNTLKKKSLNTSITDTFDFNKTVLIYNDVWLDCKGAFDYNLLYDPYENVIFCKLIIYYGGSRGMCPKDSWILVSKPKTDTKIKVQTIYLH